MRYRLCLLPLLFVASASIAASPKDASEFFGLANVWEFHFTVSADDWATMMPKNVSRPGAPPQPGGPVLRGGPGGGGPNGPGQRPGPPPKTEYAYVHATLRFHDLTLKDIGLRFKGNSSFRAPGNNGLKFPLKLDFNHFTESQKFLGLSQLNLSNNAMDPAQGRETLAYAISRDAGVPASRTAFVKVFLTVPGQFDDRYVGLYTAVEDVGSPFLKSHFDSAKGMLLKPEGARDFQYQGDDWSMYKQRLAPHDPPKTAQAERFIALSRLIHQSDDDAFRAQLPKLLDVDRFLRFVAVNGALANMDSFLCTGHNFYLYLDPKTDRFTFIPWDLNEAFAGFQMPGDADKQADLSIAHPHAGQNRLIERTLAVPEYDAAYRKHLADLIAGPLSAKSIDERLKQIELATRPALDAEKTQPANPRPDRPNDFRPRPPGGPGGGGPNMRNKPDIRDFTARRVASISSQLAGQSQGQLLEMRRGPNGPGNPPGQNPRPPRDGNPPPDRRP